jgi:hypothetical protein
MGVGMYQRDWGDRGDVGVLRLFRMGTVKDVCGLSQRLIRYSIRKTLNEVKQVQKAVGNLEVQDQIMMIVVIVVGLAFQDHDHHGECALVHDQMCVDVGYLSSRVKDEHLQQVSLPPKYQNLKDVHC